MKIGALLRQLNMFLSFCNIDITIISVLKTIVEIQTTLPCQTPFDACLCTNLTNILMSISLLIFSRIKRLLQLHPHLWFHRFTWHIKLCRQTTAQQPFVLLFLKQIDTICSYITQQTLAQREHNIVRTITTRQRELRTMA